MPTTDQLQAEITALTARVNAIDGVGLPTGVVSDIANLQAQINSNSKDLKQSLLIIQQQLNTVMTLLNQYITLVNTKLGATSS